MAYNLVPEHLDDFRRGGRIDEHRVHEHALDLIDRFDIRARPNDPVATLSGGNIQKVLLRSLARSAPARRLAADARTRRRGHRVRAFAAARPPRGSRDRPRVSEDLDELLALSDRLVVLYEGRVVGEMGTRDADPEQLGMLMAGRGRAA